MKRENKTVKSARTLKFKLMLFLTALVIPLILILYFNNYYSAALADEQVRDSTKKVLDTYVEQVDTQMSSLSEYLLKMCTEDAQSLNVDDRNERYFVMLGLHEELQKIIGLYEDTVEGIFVFQEKYDEFSYYTKSTLNYKESSKVSDYIKGHINDTLAVNAQTWKGQEFSGKHYLFYTLKVEDVYIGAWICVEDIISQIRLLDMKNILAIYLNDFEGKNFYADSLGLGEVDSDSNLQYRIATNLKAADMEIDIVLEKTSFYKTLSGFQKIIIVASIIIIFAMMCFILIYRYYIFTPLDNIVNAIGQVEQGNLEFRLDEEANSEEISHINHNFNAMTSEIKNLKINIYEKEIHRQKVELEYLHYQIKPHFFLNVINTINSLAQIKEDDLIQEMTQYLSTYIRYTFRSENATVSLKDELKTVKSYIGMQLLRFPDSLEYTMDIENEAAEVKIPVMTVLTFVENIIKHAFDMYACTKIDISARVQQAEGIRIVIKDNGKGFSQEAIDHIMSNEEINEGGKQVGIVNIKKRLRLTYGEKAKIKAYNSQGATIEIFIPFVEA